MTEKENDRGLYDNLKELGYHIPEHCIDLEINAPLDDVVVVTCSYFLYKEKPIDVDWGKAKLAAKKVTDFTKEESFLLGVKWAVEQIKESK